MVRGEKKVMAKNSSQIIIITLLFLKDRTKMKWRDRDSTKSSSTFSDRAFIDFRAGSICPANTQYPTNNRKITQL